MAKSNLTAAFTSLNGGLGFVPFLTAGYPDLGACREILLRLPEAGADIVELGMPFSDPVADGVALQIASQRALENGANLDFVLELAAAFRRAHPAVPLVLMGYANPIYRKGYVNFANRAAAAGADGVIAVDLPLEEDEPLGAALKGADLAHIKMATPATDEKRLRMLLKDASGFLYYVTVAAVTGSKSANIKSLVGTLADLRSVVALPLVAGFGFRRGRAAAALKGVADAVVVGSALADAIRAAGSPRAAVGAAIAFASEFSGELKS